MKKENVLSKSVHRDIKEDCFYRNIQLLNIIFYLGKGFMIRGQLIILLRKFYGINEHRTNDMLQELLANGLLIKKQATTTQTKLYIMTKFPLSLYRNNISSRDETSIKLNNRKIWNNLYRIEFIIREILPMMENNNEIVSLENFFDFLSKNSISLFYTENQISVYQLYQNIEEHFDIPEKDAIRNGRPISSFFYNDFYKCYADAFQFQNNFLHMDCEDDISYYLDIKNRILDEKDLTHSPKERKKNYYNLFNMVSAGFFFIQPPNKNNEVIIGTFDRCNNMYLKRIYENIICIWLMLERYLSFYPFIKLKVYMCDLNNLEDLKIKESQPGYNYYNQEPSSVSKKLTFFKNMNIPQQYWHYIKVEYVYFPLKEKYNL